MARNEALALGATDRGRLQALVGNRNTPQKHVFRAAIVLSLAEGLTAVAVQRRTGASQPAVRRWRERFRGEGGDGLLRHKTRPPRTPPPPPATGRPLGGTTLPPRPPPAPHRSSPLPAQAL